MNIQRGMGVPDESFAGMEASVEPTRMYLRRLEEGIPIAHTKL